MSHLQQWVGIDWGTSNLRAWLVSVDGSIISSAQSDDGMSSLNSTQYPRILSGLLEKFNLSSEIKIDVWISGMAGARQGWMEAPYITVPALLRDLDAGAVNPPNAPGAANVRILPGLSQSNGHEDVMRGEETQLLGLLALNPQFEGVVCMPGTHCKWVEIQRGTVTRFATAMTGELFAVLSEHSVLRHSLNGDSEGPGLEQGIADGLNAGIAHPERLSANLFRTRAASLLSGKGPDWCSGYLSGLLVGSEVAAHRDWIGTMPVALLGSERLSRLYGSALAMLGANSHSYDVGAATRAGLSAAREHFYA